MNLAPIIVFTFNRLEHTIKTIESLKKNNLASQSELFIFSDGARNEEEVNVVNKVREYIHSIDGFKKVTVIEAIKNKGLATSIIDGVTDIINKYNKVIVLEDDLVTSKYFLEYMNDALNLYEEREDIWSISGYSPNIEISNDYKDNVYLIRRASSWGWATWKNRWKLIDWDIKDYTEFKKDKKKKKEFNMVGTDVTPMLEDQMKKRIDSWAIRWVYNQYKLNKWTVYPIKSFIKNIGTDLSGTHSSITDKYNNKLIDENIEINKNIKIYEPLCKEFKKFYDLGIGGYIAIIIKKIGLYKQARSLRNKIIKIFYYKEHKWKKKEQ